MVRVKEEAVERSVEPKRDLRKVLREAAEKNRVRPGWTKRAMPTLRKQR